MQHASKIINFRNDMLGENEPLTVDDEYEVCEEHGEYIHSKLTEKGLICINPSCPSCRKDARVKAILGGSGIQKRFQGCTFENFITQGESQEIVKLRAEKFASNFEAVLQKGSSLILSGTVGTGKTHLACAIANEIAKKGYSSIFRTVSELVQAIRNTWNFSSEKTTSQVMDEFKSVDLLIIDEFGVQNGTDNELNIIFEIVNARYADQKPIIALTNLDEDGFRELSPRVHDRLKHNGLFITMNWGSYRARR